MIPVFHTIARKTVYFIHNSASFTMGGTVMKEKTYRSYG